MARRRQPFTSQWYAAPRSREAVKRFGLDTMVAVRRRVEKLPGGGTMQLLVLVLLVIASTWFVPPRTFLPEPEVVHSRDSLTMTTVPTVPPVNSTISTGRIGVAHGSEQGPLAVIHAAAQVEEPTADAENDDQLLPRHRILLLYGLPGEPSTGVVGSYQTDRLLEILQEKANEYSELDPNRPVILGLEIIASMGQKVPGTDGSYLKATSVATIYQYVEFTRSNGMVLFLDVHVGRRAVPDEVTRLEQFLLQPHVHLAIDTEFDVERTEVPTVDIGSTSAAEIRWAQDYLAELAEAHNLPTKVLMVHVFDEEMIRNRPLLRAVDGVQLVVDVSLWGDADTKRAAYQALVADAPGEFGGIMINSTWDTPALSAEDVINLPAAPDIVIFQ